MAISKRKESILKKKNKHLIIAGIILAVIIAFFALANFFTDWLWFAELGYVSVFFKELLTKITYGVPVFLLIAIGSYIYLMSMK